MKSVRNAMRLLLTFCDDVPSHRVSDLAARTGMTKGHVSKLLAEFARAGVLVQDPVTRSYSVGLRSYVLGSRFINNDRLARESIPIMRQLMDESGHSARLSIMDGDRVLYLLSMEGPLFVDTGFRSGTWLPVHSTTAGRVLLAFMDAERRRGLLSAAPLPRWTERTVIDRRKLSAILEQIRVRGYATQCGETTRNLGAVGVPIFTDAPDGVAALTVALPAHMLDARTEAALVEQLHSAARGISLRLGCRAYPYGQARNAARYLRAPRRLVGRRN